MRIDGASKSSAAVSADVTDLMSRLDAGDVIKAKVIEITSDEAVLRLFDGTSLKARLTEKLDAYAGQAITLRVASKSEGTLVLETVMGTNGRFQIKPDILKNILESLNLKPNGKNAEVAAELMKAGQPVTKDSIGKALQLMESIRDLTADKAVFLSSKNINSILADPKIAAGLLNGELKLGNLLGDLQTAIEKALGDTSGSDVVLKNTVGALKDMTGQTGPASGSEEGSTASSGTARPDSVGTPGVVASGRQSYAADGNKTNTASGAAAGTLVSGQETTGNDTSNNTSGKVSGSLSGQNEDPDNIISGNTSTGVPNTISKSNPGSRAISETIFSNSEDGALNSVKGQQASGASSARSEESRNNILIKPADEESVNTGIQKTLLKAQKKDRSIGIGDLTSDEAVNRQEAGKAASGRLTELSENLKSLFVGTDQDKLADALDAGKLYKELDNGLDTVKNAVHAMTLQGTQADAVSNAANLLSDAVRLIDQLNSGGMTYYQIPLKISDNNTTAELFIMKRQRGKKKIDPNNTVMFIALETVNMGRVETLVDVKGKNVGIQLRTEKQEIGEYIREYTKDLYKGLSELGYKLTGIRFKTMDEPANPMEQERLLKEMEKEIAGRVDFRI
ncbi:MAG TPA: flagellar hook-length control protein FliK [Clostridia bacterium]|nr:flagellar hook-length control protein FliK [Clostridia bacterium]